MLRILADSIVNFAKTNLSKTVNLRPVIATYHITHRCNLNCFFCEECGIDQNKKWENEGELSTNDAIKLLRLLRSRFTLLYITGGEPFIRNDAAEIFSEIGKLKFRNVAVNTNLSYMDRVERCLPNITNLIVSIDSIEPERFDEIRGVKGMGKRILANFERAIALQKRFNFKLNVNCVVTPSTINDARKVLKFCVKNNVKVGVNAQNDKHGPIKNLVQNAEFKTFVKEIIELKKKTRLVAGTVYYYERMFSFIPYVCYPTLTPRINAKGELAWPCDNLNQWVPNIVSEGSWKKIIAKAETLYGKVAPCDKRCQFQCYIEPSRIAKKPWLAITEYLA